MLFLQGTTPIWGTQDLPDRFKEWKASLMEVGQTAHKLETNARANFPNGRQLGISMCREWGEKHANTDIFVAHSAFRHNIETNQAPRYISRERAESYFSFVRRTYAEQRYHP